MSEQPFVRFYDRQIERFERELSRHKQGIDAALVRVETALCPHRHKTMRGGRRTCLDCGAHLEGGR